MAEFGQGSGPGQEDINHNESQRILKEEQRRVGSQDLSTLFENIEEEHDLQGPPLPLKEVKKLCSNDYVRDVLFRKSGRAKETAPLKLSDLQHTGLAKVILQKFIEKEKSLPNNNQVAIYFVQQLFVEQILRRQVDWDSRPPNAGVGRGRPGDRAAARRENTELQRNKPVVLSQQVHTTMVNMAEGAAKRVAELEGATGRIAQLEDELQEARDEAARLRAELSRYEMAYGPLTQSPDLTFELAEMVSQVEENAADGSF